jgi:hypothetical protein
MTGKHAIDIRTENRVPAGRTQNRMLQTDSQFFIFNAELPITRAG